MCGSQAPRRSRRPARHDTSSCSRRCGRGHLRRGRLASRHCIRQVREALGDDAASPTYIATSHRRGYRFIGQPLAGRRRARLPVPSPPAVVTSALPTGLHDAAAAAPRLLGRDAELAAMRGWLGAGAGGANARSSSSPANLVSARRRSWTRWLEQKRRPTVPTPRGQCLQQYGQAERHLPVTGRALRDWAARPPGAHTELAPP